LKRRIIAMIGIAAVFGAASIFAADLWLRGQASARADAPPPPADPKVEFGSIVVAKEPLRYGMTIDAAQLTQIAWPQEALPQGAFATSAELLADGPRMVLSPMEPNEPVLLAKLSGPNGRASLSNLLSPGMRAVTIRTDEIAGVGGFVTPGDRVDVVLTRDAGEIVEVVSNAQGADGSTITSEVVVADVKVLSVGQGADERQTQPQVAGSVTIEVTTEGAQKVALARKIGSLSLSLRSAGEVGTVADGLTTISAFGGSVGAGFDETVGGAVEAVIEAPEQRFKTVLVTRGMEEAQEYQVVAPQD
jgi:pilus assembly protein CpaB